MKQHIVIEQRKSAKVKDSKKKVKRFEIFHIVGIKDALGNDVYTKTSVGTTTVKILTGEVQEHELQASYRRQLLALIEDMKLKGIKSTNVKESVEEYIKDHKKDN